MKMIYVGNDGPEISQTNYWQSEHAERGLLHLSPNAGVLRLLVPPNQEALLTEMRTGRRATIENSIQVPGNMDVVFEDNTSSPFCVSMHRQQCSGIPQKGNWKLAVWTQAGKQMEFPCKVKSTGSRG